MVAYIISLIVVCLLVGIGEVIYRVFFGPDQWD